MYDVFHGEGSSPWIPEYARDQDMRKHDMDLNAGSIINGETTIEQIGEEAFEKLLRVLSGEWNGHNHGGGVG